MQGTAGAAKKRTGLGAVEFESVHAAQLYLDSNKPNMDDKMSKALLDERYKCVIYKIMNSNDDTQELDFYLGKLIDCLARDKVFPPQQKYIQQRKYETKDVTDAQEVLTHIMNSSDLIMKRGLIWLGLRISSSFINIFCPPPDERLNRRFLVNPEKLAMMIKGDEQPLRFNLSAFCNDSQNFTIEHCVTCCCVEWNSLMPWLDHAVWSVMDANAASADLSNTKRKRLTIPEPQTVDLLEF